MNPTKTMEVIKRQKNANYTVISNVFLRDTNISLDAKGLLALIMSLPENWDFSVNGMVAIVKEGRNHVYNSIKELLENGYCTRTYLYEWRGTIKVRAGVEYTFFEEPALQAGNLNTENLNLGMQNLENLNLGNDTQISIDSKEVKKGKSKDVNSFAPSNEATPKTTKKKEPKQKTAHEAYKPICDLFHEFYLQKKGEPYTGFNGRQGKELNELIKKAETKLKYANRLTENYAPAPNEVVAYVENILSNNTDVFFQKNLTISTFNTQFDNISLSVPKTAQNLSEKASKMKYVLCSVFSITETNTLSIGAVNEFLAHFQNNEKFKGVLLQCWFYAEYVRVNGKKFACGLNKFLGTPTLDFADGQWNACNWQEKFNECNVKP